MRFDLPHLYYSFTPHVPEKYNARYIVINWEWRGLERDSAIGDRANESNIEYSRTATPTAKRTTIPMKQPTVNGSSENWMMTQKKCANTCSLNLFCL